MRALVNAPLPAHDQETDAVVLYAERAVTVQSAERITIRLRMAYKILRPEGRGLGDLALPFGSETRITALRAWCIPAQGKDYEVSDKDSAEAAVPGSELITDVREKKLRIPAADPGNIIGFEVEQDAHPYVLQDSWYFQESLPVREARYSVHLPAGWTLKPVLLNSPAIKPTVASGTAWEWAITDIKAVKFEDSMPPLEAVAGRIIVSFFPGDPGAANKGFDTWQAVAQWYGRLTRDRMAATPEMSRKVAALTASSRTSLERTQALARFVQHDVRYAGIHLGIGAFQPHPAGDVLQNLYGDCKDKATLLSAMLSEAGISSFLVLVNHERGVIGPGDPPQAGFDHMIVAIRLPYGLADPSLLAVQNHPRWGNLLFFDPTDELVPLGQLRGPLQANYGLLVAPDGGELLELPLLPAATNGVTRTAKLALSPRGVLAGSVIDSGRGDSARQRRGKLHSDSQHFDKTRMVEQILASSLNSSRLDQVEVHDLDDLAQPVKLEYSFVVEGYAKPAGDLLLLRPRVLGAKADEWLESAAPRQYPVEFDHLLHDEDTFEIILPVGFTVDELPLPVDADFGFAAYHSSSSVHGDVLRYQRTFDLKQLSVPLDQVEELKKLERIVADDERNVAVLKPSAH
jgi:hypothetical protein